MCRWIERTCVLGEGDYYGQPVRLRRWQRALIYRLYELNPDGSRRYRRALIGFAKGSGKTPLASWIADVELAGPVVFDGWNDDGTPRGTMRTSPVVVVGAASFEQADLVFGEMKTTWRESAVLGGLAEVYDTEILLRDLPGKAYRIAAARATNDGGRPTCFVADEFHEWNTPAQEGAHLVVANGTAKRDDSLQLAITTAGADKESLCGRWYTHGRKVLAGKVVDPSFLFVWYEAPEGLDPTNPDDVRKGIRAASPAADDFLDVEEVAAQFARIPEFEGRRYFWNQWTRAADSWLPAGAWERCASELELGETVYAAVDASLYHDSTALVTVSPVGDRLVARAQVWDPTATGSVDIGAVKQAVRDLCDGHDVQVVRYDPRLFELAAAELLDENVPMEEFPQSPERMVPACGDAYQAIVDGLLAHDGDPVLTDHVLSAAQRVTDRGWTLSKGRSKRHIDACVALVMALDAARRPPEAEFTSVYEARGLVQL